MRVKILIGSRNPDKIGEITRILGMKGVRFITERELPDVEEDRETFFGNALKKARETSLERGCAVLADDSGLEVDALDGAPGVRSARFSGVDKDYLANNRKLLEELKGVPREKRSARFMTCAVIYFPFGLIISATGRCEGSILEEPRGDGGFGYDPLFLVRGAGVTMAEMSSEEKNAISHRGRALTSLQGKLRDILPLITP